MPAGADVEAAGRVRGCVPMTAARNGTTLKSVTRERPCALCEGADGCSYGEDGLLLCRRRKGAQPGFVCLGEAKKNPEWTQYRREDDQLTENDRRRAKPSPFASRIPGSNGQHKAHAVDWRGKADGFAKQITPELAEELAEALGLPCNTLAEEMPLLGFCFDSPHAEPGGPCWTLPEMDAAGQVVGINCRYRNGDKKAYPGSLRGLTIPERFRQRAGPILLPEGASDVLALSSVGIAAIGRPSNMGGVENLAVLLANVPAEREIIVLGEFDTNDKGQWPGREGAVKVTADLAEKLGRTIRYAFPPDKAKDVRAWVRSKNPDPACLDEWNELGEELVRKLRRLDTKASTAESMPHRFRWEPIDSATFAATEYRIQWLAEKALVFGQPCIIGAPQKTLKTSFAIDLAVSLASAAPWLGTFICPVRRRVAVLSGESGPFALQSTARRVCAAKGIELADLGDNLRWMFVLPQLAVDDQLAALAAGLKRDGVEVAIIDPMYLCLLSGANGPEASNLYDIGPLLLRVTQACLNAGATPILLHHCTKPTARKLEPLELGDLAFAGVGEFARQWILLSRREAYDHSTGLHQLWMVAGGSVGHGGCWAVDVDEGQLAEDFSGRHWKVDVVVASAARKQEKDIKAEAKAAEAKHRDQVDEVALVAALQQLAPCNEAVPYGRVRDLAGLSKEKMSRAFERLLAAKAVERVQVVIEIANGAKRPGIGIKKRTGDEHGEHESGT